VRLLDLPESILEACVEQVDWRDKRSLARLRLVCTRLSDMASAALVHTIWARDSDQVASLLEMLARCPHTGQAVRCLHYVLIHYFSDDERHAMLELLPKLLVAVPALRRFELEFDPRSDIAVGGSEGQDSDEATDGGEPGLEDSLERLEGLRHVQLYFQPRTNAIVAPDDAPDNLSSAICLAVRNSVHTLDIFGGEEHAVMMCEADESESYPLLRKLIAPLANTALICDVVARAPNLVDIEHEDIIAVAEALPDVVATRLRRLRSSDAEPGGSSGPNMPLLPEHTRRLPAIEDVEIAGEAFASIDELATLAPTITRLDVAWHNSVDTIEAFSSWIARPSSLPNLTVLVHYVWVEDKWVEYCPRLVAACASRGLQCVDGLGRMRGRVSRIRDDD